MGDWQTIAAYEPKNHGRVDLWCVSYVVDWTRRATPQEPKRQEARFVAYEWDGYSQRWVGLDGKTLNELEWRVTHFMPLPSAPMDVNVRAGGRG